MIPHATALSERFTDLQEKLANIFDPAGIAEERIAISQKLEDLTWDLRFLKTAARQNYNQLAFIKSEIVNQSQAVMEIKEPLSSDLQKLATWQDEWAAEKRQLPQWRESVGTEISLDTIENTFANIETTIDKALQLISQRLQVMLTADEPLGELQVKIHTLNTEVDKLIIMIRQSGYQKTLPVMFSTDFYAQFNRELWVSAGKGIKALIFELEKLFANRFGIVLLVIAGCLVLSAVISRSGRFLQETAKWQLFAESPLASAVFIWMVLIGMFFEHIPPRWDQVIQAAVIIAAMRLARGLVHASWEKRTANQLAVILLLEVFLAMANPPLPLIRLYLVFIALLALVFCVRQALWLRKSSPSAMILWGLLVATLVLLTCLVAGVMGYVQFALYLGNSFFGTLFIALVVRIMYVATSGAVELIFFKSPFAILKRNASLIVGRLRPLIVLFFFGLLLVYTLETWQVYASKGNALQGLLSFGTSLGSGGFTLGAVLTAALVMYGAILTSLALQALLLSEILPRRQMESGVQHSIARLVHYALISIGALMALSTLGFGFKNLTIIGGALGVGIGFGLQAIVNNFASGLILLFERPIKVGDTIQVGSEMGVVKHLGLRSTVVATYDDAEIVVPNSNLITNQVTNMTLGERRIRLKLPVGVAYGSDVARVMGILMSCANEHQEVLKDPAPRVLFLEFGTSSLDFELRVWIGDFDQRRGVQSDLNQAIDTRFRRAGIEIPFPQRDLHLRSVDEPAASSLNPAPVSGKKRDEASE